MVIALLDVLGDDRERGVTPHRRVAALDGLRSVAVMLVFAGHSNPTLLPGGFMGVELFFVISGYLITSLLLSERASTGEISLRRFYIRRALRLFPALIVVVVVVTPIAVVQNIGGRPILDAIAALTYVTDFYGIAFGHISLLRHTWSLAVEEQFYLVWPVFLIFLLRRRLPVPAILIGLCVIGLAIGFAFDGTYVHHHPFVVDYLPTSHLPELASGILLAFAELPQPSRWLVRLTSLPVALVAVVALAVAQFTFNGGGWWQYPFATVICWPLVAHLVIHPGSLVSAALRLRPLVWLGRRSYAVYLWHYPIVLLIFLNTPLTGWLNFAVALPLTLLIAAVSWRLVESPCLRLKQRFEPQSPPPSASRSVCDSAAGPEAATSPGVRQPASSPAGTTAPTPTLRLDQDPADENLKKSHGQSPSSTDP
jgi:peptidoglycan/LPS O-acetylase OafA/YrhL